MTFGRLAIIFASLTSVAVLAPFGFAQGRQAEPDWKALEVETMQHYQAVLRMDTRNPPGNEVVVAEYVKGVLDKEGIPATLVGSDPKRPNLIARHAGSLWPKGMPHSPAYTGYFACMNQKFASRWASVRPWS